MRAQEFTKQLQQLDEVAMNPNSLRQLASKIPGATAGMEFEMYVPNANAGEENDGDMEENYGDNPRTRSIDDICDFFYDGDYNGRQDITRLRDKLQEQYSEYSYEYLGEKWKQDGREELRQYMLNNGDIDRDDIIGEATEEIKEANPELPDDSADFGDLVSARADEIINEKVDEEWTDEGRTYDRAREDWESDNEWPDEGDWLRASGYSHMDDISNDRDFAITWPHWTSSGGGELSVEDVAGQFEQAIGRNVNFSDIYHGGTRDETSYVVEPDGSLHDKRDNDDAGLEFISPPLPISEMLSDLDKVKAWADENNCYTNKSTGLHINVSVPGITEESLDYVKLAILLGDKYVLEQFGRASNTYCRSSLDLVKQNAASRPEDALKIMDTMRRGLNTMAAKAIHSGATAKFVSINNKDGYIEFRSPGGDWLGTNFDKIETTLLRTVVAVDAAINPQKYRKEYLTKLYKMLNVKGENDPIAYFARYAAGEMPVAALKSFIKQLQTTRAVAKAAPPAPERAAAPVRQSQPGDRGWNLFDNLGNLVDTFTAATQGEANALAQAWLRTNWREASNGPYEVVPAGAN